MDAKPSPLAAPAGLKQQVTAPERVAEPLSAAPAKHQGATPQAIAYVLDQSSEAVVRRSFADSNLEAVRIVRGDINTAIHELSSQAWPHLLIVDVSGIADPMARVTRMAEISDPTTEVIVIGDRNDIVLYRDMIAAGVKEYFFKPLVTNLVTRAVGGGSTGAGPHPGARTGKLVVVLGVRGGVGATTIATQAAWYLAEDRQRPVMMLDLDLQSGDAALQLDVQPSHALREALEHSDRIDELFLERGVTHVSDHLGLLASLEPLSDVAKPAEDAVMQLAGILMRRYRFVIVDVPTLVALELPKLLQSANTILLVSDGSLLSVREIARWRERIGRNTPDRMTLHILNKKGADGTLPEAELKRALGMAPEISIPYERDIARTAVLGARALHENATMRRWMPALTRELAGAETVSRTAKGLWKRVFG